MLYFSYAANLNHLHMAHLCPEAQPLFPAVLENYIMSVRQWFNIEPEDGAVVYGGVWEIREGNVARLDSYEDSPELYERRTMSVVPAEQWSMGAWERGRKVHDCAKLNRCSSEKFQGIRNSATYNTCLVYVMKRPFSIPLSLPEPDYLEMVREGYREWRIPEKQIIDALGSLPGR